MSASSQTDPAARRAGASPRRSRAPGTQDHPDAPGRPAWNGLNDAVDLSVGMVERAVESFGILKDEFRFSKDLAEQLYAKLEAGRARCDEGRQALADAARAVKAERDRALAAESDAHKRDEAVKDLQQDVAGLGSQIRRLFEAVPLLVSAEIDARGDSDAFQD